MRSISDYLYPMKYLFALFCSGLLFGGAVHAQLSFSKIDSTLKVGKVGYHVICRNKSIDENQLTIKPVGFESGDGSREMNFMIRGRIARSEITDFNSDGFPDLVIYIYSDTSADFGTVYAFLSEANKSISPCVLPDVMLNGKVNTGYKGHDTFSLMESYLLQKFPIYKTGDAKDKPTGGTRAILYQLDRNKEGAGYTFNIVRNYDTQ